MTKLKPIGQQVIVLTGASSGIGLTTARLAARRGASLMLASRNEEALRTVTQELRDSGATASYTVADVGDRQQVSAIHEATIAEFGGYDTWVNNAGVSLFGTLEETSVEDMRRLFETNFWGVVYGSLAALEHLKERGGAIITVGSVFSDVATPVQSIYSASKHAVKGFTDALRMEIRAVRYPVSVTQIKPGRINTPYNEHARSYQETKPPHRGIVYPPDSVAEAILYCAAHPRREMYVGSQARFAATLGAIAPSLTDVIIEKTQWRAYRTNRTSRAPNDNALYSAGFGLRERGNHLGWMRSSSLYTKASMHPLAVACCGIIAAGVVLPALWKRNQ